MNYPNMDVSVKVGRMISPTRLAVSQARPIRRSTPPASGVGDWKNRPANEIEQRCLAVGLKMTGQRRVIAQVLSGESDHPDVEKLYRLAVAIDKKISVATVYRTVRLFEEKGILSRLDFGGGRARYEPSDHSPHYHLIDVDTGKVFEFQDEALETLLFGIASRLGFVPVATRLELFGKQSSNQSKQARAPYHQRTEA